jgi:hypothetical protein
MSDVPSKLRTQVVLRAGNRCEYCRLSQVSQEAAMESGTAMPAPNPAVCDPEMDIDEPIS